MEKRYDWPCELVEWQQKSNSICLTAKMYHGAKHNIFILVSSFQNQHAVVVRNKTDKRAVCTFWQEYYTQQNNYITIIVDHYYYYLLISLWLFIHKKQVKWTFLNLIWKSSILMLPKLRTQAKQTRSVTILGISQFYLSRIGVLPSNTIICSGSFCMYPVIASPLRWNFSFSCWGVSSWHLHILIRWWPAGVIIFWCDSCIAARYSSEPSLYITSNHTQPITSLQLHPSQHNSHTDDSF